MLSKSASRPFFAATNNAEPSETGEHHRVDHRPRHRLGQTHVVEKDECLVTVDALPLNEAETGRTVRAHDADEAPSSVRKRRIVDVHCDPVELEAQFTAAAGTRVNPDFAVITGITAAPEPATLALMLAGLCLPGSTARRVRSAPLAPR